MSRPFTILSALLLPMFCEGVIRSILQDCFHPRIETSSVNSSPLNNQLDSITQPQSFLCDFESGPCCWGHSESEGSRDWFVLSQRVGKPIKGRVRKCFGTLEAPFGNFMAAYSDTPVRSSDKAVLLSCFIECSHTGTVSVSLKHWLTEDTTLRVCTQPINRQSSVAKVCKRITHDNPGPSSVTLPVPRCGTCEMNKDLEDTPVDLTLEASGFVSIDGGIVAVDDIVVHNAQLGSCKNMLPGVVVESQEEGVSQGITNTVELLPALSDAKETAICNAFACDFESATKPKCNYTDLSSLNSTQITNQFEVTTGPLGNRDTGISRNVVDSVPQSFAAVQLRPNQTAVLRSKRLAAKFVPEWMTVAFQYYKAASDVSLRLCLDEAQLTCPFDSGKDFANSHRSWRAVNVAIGGAERLYFIAQSDAHEAVVAVDQVVLLNGEKELCGR